MSSQNSKNNKGRNKNIPDSSSKKARGSKSVHSPLDDSQEDGWKPNTKDNSKSEEE